MIVYLVTNLINNKQYVGFTTKSLEERKKKHVLDSNNKNIKHHFYLFKLAIRKYGIENFKWEIIKEYNNLQDCLEGEKVYIRFYNTISPNGYNLTEGGRGGVPSNETKEKISKTLKKYWHENAGSHAWVNLDTETRIGWANKSWITKKENGYIAPSGYNLTESAKKQMSLTKNKLGSLAWINLLTNDKQFLSCTDMATYTGLSISTFSHIKKGRTVKTKCGWQLDLS